MNILITGASGFIGSFIVERALALGHEVWAAVRSTSSRRWLQDPRIHFIELSLGNLDRLKAELQAFKSDGGRWDYVVHGAGATKARSEADFMEANCENTKHLTLALNETCLAPKRMVVLSSFSVLGAPAEQALAPEERSEGWNYRALSDDETPQPNTAYGRSKLACEEWLKRACPFPCIILRPTGVYGPREKDYFLMAKSIRQHIDFAVGFRPQEITFIYVRDLVEAVFLAFDHGRSGQTYVLSDGQTYHSRAFSNLLQREMGVGHVLHITAPVWLLRVVCSASTLLSKLTGRMSALNNDKFNILRQRNWRCDISKASRELNYTPHYPLERGVKETVAWYKENQWI